MGWDGMSVTRWLSIIRTDTDTDTGHGMGEIVGHRSRQGREQSVDGGGMEGTAERGYRIQDTGYSRERRRWVEDYA